MEYSPIVSGMVNTYGPRHCPSIDRKVLNFPDKAKHQIFLEMESENSDEIYVNRPLSGPQPERTLRPSTKFVLPAPLCPVIKFNPDDHESRSGCKFLKLWK